MKRHFIILMLIILSLILSSCSKGNIEFMKEVVPSSNADSLISYFTPSDFPQIFGAYTLTISKGCESVELTPMRELTLGESWLVNGMIYFTVTPCSNCLRVQSIGLDSYGVKLTFSITHPFKPGDTSQPPSATNRRDLDVFDVALIVVPKDITPNLYSLGAVYSKICVNQAGYTRELESIIGNSAACPYFLIVDDSTSGISTFNRFAMGTTNKLFDVWFSDVGTYNLYLTMGYGASAKKAQRLNPKYFNPEFNRKAAWKVKVTPPEGNNPPAVGNTWNDADTTTPYYVTVNVYDWQIGATVNPSMVNTTDIYASSNVASVSVEIPGMTPAPVVRTTPTSGSGKPNDPQVFRVPIANTNGLPPGKYTGLVKVLDERIPPQSFVDRDYMIDFVLSSKMENVAPTWPFRAEDVASKHPYVYVISEAHGLKIVNVSNPKAAYLEGSLSLSGLKCVDASGSYAYVCDNNSLKIVDVSVPASPTIVGQVTALNSPRDIVVASGYAYVATFGGVVVIDVDPPASAAVKAGVKTYAEPRRLCVANGFVYMTTGLGSSSFLEIVSVENPLNAYWVSVTNLMLPAGYASGIDVYDEFAYVAVRKTYLGDRDYLLIVDVYPPENPYVWKLIDLYELGADVDYINGYAYVTSYNLLHVVDVTPVISAHIVATVNLPGISANSDLGGNYIYIANDNQSLMIIPQYIPPGGGLMNYAIPEYATYQTFTATVVDG